MEVLKGIEKPLDFSVNTAVAIGNFDGIHLGHQKILHSLVHEAKKTNLISTILTFSPHPEKILGKSNLKMIQTIEQRIAGLEKYGVQLVIILNFNKNLSSMSGENFIKYILINKLKAKIILVGEKFRFGKKREGSISILKKLSHNLHFRVISIPSVVKKGNILSSSLIRNLLEKGEVEKAKDLLGSPYMIEGNVMKGSSRGKTIGFPTANIHAKNEIIPSGVFITTVHIGSKSFPSLTNVGNCPTFHQKETNIESYIINFDKNLYGKKITIHFMKKIRKEMEFQNSEELSNHVKMDLEAAKDYFNLP